MLYKAIDIFAGAGGLSVGLKNAGIEIIEAIEINRDAADTYKLNHPEVNVNCNDISLIEDSYFEILKQKGVNIVVGCPPCQGFSSLTSNVDDPRNMLVLQFLRAIQIIDPVAVMMENVPGITKRGKAIFEKLLNELEKRGYKTNHKVLQVADYGVPQLRKRLVLFAAKQQLIPMPEPTHKAEKNDSCEKWVSIRELFNKYNLKEPLSIKDAIAKNVHNAFNWNITRELAPINRERLKYLKPGSDRYSIPDELRPPCHRGKNKGYGNVYARMEWDKPSPTITSGCTTMSTGRFLHPENDRTISVREAALIQTFPLNYAFTPKEMEKVCRLIGNALPCLFAEVLAKHMLQHLKV